MIPPPAPMPELAGRRVLLAYGLAGEAIARLAPVGFDYMGTQLAWLRACDAEAQVVPLPTAAAVEDNATLLAGAILASPAPCLLLSHSKGGLEALAALLRPGVAARCQAFLALQSPFLGSPVADALLGNAGFHGVARQLAQLLRVGSGAGLVDLTSTVRTAWMQERAPQIAALTASLPVLCIGTQVKRDSAVGPDRRYLPLAEWLEKRGAGANDGLVPVASALLPGARHWVLNASHRALVSAGEGRDPVGILRQALEALLAVPALQIEAVETP
jgi:alpha-beta hydrolase superfamily lysophospholipase